MYTFFVCLLEYLDNYKLWFGLKSKIIILLLFMTSRNNMDEFKIGIIDIVHIAKHRQRQSSRANTSIS